MVNISILCQQIYFRTQNFEIISSSPKDLVKKPLLEPHSSNLLLFCRLNKLEIVVIRFSTANQCASIAEANLC